MLRIQCWLISSLLVHSLVAVEPQQVELKNVDDWVRDSFTDEEIISRHDGYLEVQLEHGPLLKNMATTKVYHKQLGALPMKINRRTYEHGLYLASPGTIRVVLPSSARHFEAVFGVDSNRVTSFYSNAGRGSVVGVVSVGDKKLYESPVMREGMPGQRVSVPLDGVQAFTISTKGSQDGVIEQVDFNQSNWANAEVELVGDAGFAWETCQ